MSQPPFDETQHPRGEGGRFATKPSPESEVDLEPAGPSPARRSEEHLEADRELYRLEAEVAGQMSRVRTAQLKQQIAYAVTRADETGAIPDGATHVLLDYDEEHVNDYGGSDYVPVKFLGADGDHISYVSSDPGRAAVARLRIPTHGDGSGPDVTADGLAAHIEDGDGLAVDLRAVRDFSASQDPSQAADRERADIARVFARTD